MLNRVVCLAVAMSFVAVAPVRAQDGEQNGKAIALKLGKVEESEANGKLPSPHFGYVGQLGSFVVTKGDMAKGMIVVHHYPDTSKSALGCTKLTLEGAKRLSDVEGWVFRTEWDGKTNPSKIFFSAEKVYFGGVHGYIAADYRDGSGWMWKLLPLRRMNMTKDTATAAAK